jgi:hypothetical protein
MRGWLSTGWNIQNMKIEKVKTNKKQRDTQAIAHPDLRNTPDRTGTSLQRQFYRCSATAAGNSTRQALANQGLQRAADITRSALFRLDG